MALGRPKGSKNKKNEIVARSIRAHGIDPIERLAMYALNRVECDVCNNVGSVTMSAWYAITKTKLEKPMTWNERRRMTACPVCGGTKKEHIDANTRAMCIKELAQYYAPKRKAIEVSGSAVDARTTIIVAPEEMSSGKWLEKFGSGKPAIEHNVSDSE